MPQLFVDVDQDRVLKQGLQFGEVYQTLQAFLGGAYVNQFNRFGRQWKVYLQAEPEYRISADKINSFYVRNSKGEMTPLGSLVTHQASLRSRVHQPFQSVSQHPDQRFARSRIQFRASNGRDGRSRRTRSCPADGIRLE